MSDAKRRTMAQWARNDFLYFVQRSFQTLNPGTQYLDNWHLDAIAHALMEVAAGKTTRLIINQPPRSLKSICTTVALSAWLLGHDPSLKIICVSYSADLSVKFSRDARRVMEQPWYRQAFPRAKLKKATDGELITELGGNRLATSIGGILTGLGADIIIIDDPLKAEEAHSDVARRAVNEWYTNTLVSRLNDKEHGVVILVMQRLHQEDLSGHLLSTGDWTQLRLPSIAQEDMVFAIGRGETHTFKTGEPLHAERESLATLEDLRRSMGSLAYAAQYLQQPENPQGNLLHWEWFQQFDGEVARETGDRIVQSWDAAQKIGIGTDYSVCTTWLRRRNGAAHYLLEVYREQLEFPDLLAAVIDRARRFNADQVLIEDTGFGTALCQEFKADARGLIVAPIKVTIGKEARFGSATVPIEQGCVYLPREASWLATFKHELTAFPLGSHDDQVDSVSQYLQWSQHEQPAIVRANVFRGIG